MQGTIKLSEFSSRSGTEEFPLESIQIEPSGVNLSFVRGRDERTHQLLRYKIALFPATLKGTWTRGDETGAIESIGVTTTGTTRGDIAAPTDRWFRGIWVEDGMRKQVEISIKF